MGIFGDIADFFGSTAEFVVDVGGGRIWTAAVDLENMTVSLADQGCGPPYRASCSPPGLGPLAGVLKNEFEDELFMMAGPQRHRRRARGLPGASSTRPPR